VKIGVILMLKQNYLVKLKYIDTKIIYLLSISPLCQHKQHQWHLECSFWNIAITKPITIQECLCSTVVTQRTT